MTRRRRVRRAASAAGLVVAALAAVVTVVRGDWLQPDASYRETQLTLRLATRDTAGHSDDPGRLDSLGVLLLRLARIDEAARVFRHVAEIDPNDKIALGALGKIALFTDHASQAESLLARADQDDPMAMADLFAAKVRLGKYSEAADMTPTVNQEGRRPLLERLTENAPYQVTGGPEVATLPFTRSYPVPLVRAKLNGNLVLMAVDTGTADLLLDEQAFRRCKVQPVAGQSVVFWSGSRAAVKNALVQKLELGGVRIQYCPAGVLNLGRWSLEINPQSERVAGVIGLNLLARFVPTIDYEKFRLVLRRAGTPVTADAGAARVPFQIWGESELMVWGTLAQSRRMGFVVQTGVPACGVGAPDEVFGEVGVKPGAMSRIVKGAGTFLQGRPWAAVVVPTVTVGSVARDKVAGWQGALDESELWRYGIRRDALIAGDFFKDRRLTIDWSAQQLIIEE
jgi:hypothetical protein